MHKSSLIVVLLALGLFGCVTREQVVFRHPATQDQQMCLKPPAMALGPADIPERNRYAECKNKWEGRGYVRSQ